MSATYNQTKQATAAFVEAIRAERTEVHQYDSASAAYFTMGYLESTIVSILEDMPAAARKRVLKEFAITAAAKQQRIQEAV